MSITQTTPNTLLYLLAIIRVSKQRVRRCTDSFRCLYCNSVVSCQSVTVSCDVVIVIVNHRVPFDCFSARFDNDSSGWTQLLTRNSFFRTYNTSIHWTLWSASTVAVFYLFDTSHCCHIGTAIKQLVPDRVKPSSVIFDIRAL